MESIKMMHLGIRKGEVGRYVFLPGSPERSEKISKYLENPIEIAYNREFLTFTGTLEGVQVSVTSTGIGGPSTAIAVEELYQCGADTMIRVGTCASVSEDFHKGDLIIPNGAVRMEGVGRHYLPTEFPAVPDFETTRILEEAAIRLNYVYKVGITIVEIGIDEFDLDLGEAGAVRRVDVQRWEEGNRPRQKKVLEYIAGAVERWWRS